MSDDEKKRRPRRRRRRKPKEGGEPPAAENKPRRRRRRRSRKKKTGGESTASNDKARQADRPRKRSRRSGGRRRRGRNRESWWSKRWSSSLDGIQVGRRVASGRKYARQGRVVELELEGGSVTAMVQGSRSAPYLVRMHFSMLGSADWRRVLQMLGNDVELGGGLFRGDFPDETEDVFTSLSLSLFPSGQGDVKASCSCPDQAMPCKHIAAAFYQLGEAIDRDPFLLFKLRGLDRTALMDALVRTPAARAELKPPPAAEDSASPAVDKGANAEDRRESEPEAKPQITEEALALDPQRFWHGTSDGDDPAEPEELPLLRTAGALARRLGGYSFWPAEATWSLVMDQLYRTAAAAGLAVYLGESGPEDDEAVK